MKIMQYAMNQKIAAFTSRLNHDANFKDRIKTDIFNATIWTDYLDKEVTGRETKSTKRIMDF